VQCNKQGIIIKYQTVEAKESARHVQGGREKEAAAIDI
jgi:hypothetical protein